MAKTVNFSKSPINPFGHYFLGCSDNNSSMTSPGLFVFSRTICECTVVVRIQFLGRGGCNAHIIKLAFPVTTSISSH